jgi:hypothetical protein
LKTAVTGFSKGTGSYPSRRDAICANSKITFKEIYPVSLTFIVYETGTLSEQL